MSKTKSEITGSETKEVKVKKAAIKALFEKGGESHPLKIESKTFVGTQQANEYIIELIKNTLEEYNSEEYENATSLPFRHTSVKFKTDKGVHNLVVRIAAFKDANGIFRKVSFDVVKT